MEYTVPAHADQLRKPNPFAHIEAALRAYLERHLPEANDFTYYTSARATEVCSGHRDRYADYPALNDRSLQEIEHELLNEVRDGRANRRPFRADTRKALSSTAPNNTPTDIHPAASDTRPRRLRGFSFSTSTMRGSTTVSRTVLLTVSCTDLSRQRSRTVRSRTVSPLRSSTTLSRRISVSASLDDE